MGEEGIGCVEIGVVCNRVGRREEDDGGEDDQETQTEARQWHGSRGASRGRPRDILRRQPAQKLGRKVAQDQRGPCSNHALRAFKCHHT